MVNQINLTLVSPSAVGDYAACSMKLLYDSIHGKPFDAGPPANFGTVCHFVATSKLGLKAKEPEEFIIRSAMTLPEFSGRAESVFYDAVNACADKAISELPPLIPGTYWIAEHKAFDKNLLPTRVGRNSKEITGFGGEIDLFRSDREMLVDFKFVGKMPTKVKTAYTWQLGSYSLVTKIPKTAIIFVSRDAKYSSKLMIDWRAPEFVEFNNQQRRVIEQMGHVNYAQYAHPVEGDQCDFCSHRTRCVLKKMPSMSARMALKVPETNMDLLESLISQAKFEKSIL